MSIDPPPFPSASYFPCPADRQVEALGVLFHRSGAAVRPALVAGMLDEDAAESSRFKLAGLWVAQRRGRLVGAMLSVPLPGRSVALWAPEVDLGWGRAAMAANLVRAVLADYRARGFRIAQALVDPGDPQAASTDLARGGLAAVTRLSFLHRDPSVPLPPGFVPAEFGPELGAGGDRLCWQTYREADRAAFSTTLDASYVGSLDMPELEGARSLDDLTDGHLTGGRFRPDLWRMAEVAGEPDARAILLISDHPTRPAWEVAYLGLTPAARGRGIGRAVVAHALELAGPHASRVELAVDARNTPARKLYAAAGFKSHGHRVVHLALLRPPGDDIPPFTA